MKQYAYLVVCIKIYTGVFLHLYQDPTRYMESFGICGVSRTVTPVFPISNHLSMSECIGLYFMSALDLLRSYSQQKTPHFTILRFMGWGLYPPTHNWPPELRPWVS